MGLQPVRDARVWAHVRRMYIFAGILFLFNLYLGFLNLVENPDIARWQTLTHAHAGTIGWITFSIIATAVWAFTGQRRVTPGYASGVNVLGWLGFVIFGGYLLSFAVAFRQGGDWFLLLPVFGALSVLLIMTGFIYTLVSMRSQPVVSTVHWLLAGALFVGSIGGIMGLMLGLQHALDRTLLGGVEPVGQHAGVMDGYLILAFSAIIEAHVRGTDARRGWAGILQTVLLVLSAMATLGGLALDVEPLLPLSLLLLVAGAITYFVRVGRHTFTQGAFHGGSRTGLFWAGIWLPIYVAFFVTLIIRFVNELPIPHWFWVLFQHSMFIGVATQLILVTHARFVPESRLGHEVLTGAFWFMNIGIILFWLGEFTLDSAAGAGVMGLGVLAGVFAMWGRMSSVRTVTAHAP